MLVYGTGYNRGKFDLYGFWATISMPIVVQYPGVHYWYIKLSQVTTAYRKPFRSSRHTSKLPAVQQSQSEKSTGLIAVSKTLRTSSAVDTYCTIILEVNAEHFW